MADKLFIDQYAEDVAAGRKPAPQSGEGMNSRLAMRVVELGLKVAELEASERRAMAIRESAECELLTVVHELKKACPDGEDPVGMARFVVARVAGIDEPGAVIWEGECPSCDAELSVQHGDDEDSQPGVVFSGGKVAELDEWSEVCGLGPMSVKDSREYIEELTSAHNHYRDRVAELEAELGRMDALAELEAKISSSALDMCERLGLGPEVTELAELLDESKEGDS